MCNSHKFATYFYVPCGIILAACFLNIYINKYENIKRKTTVGRPNKRFMDAVKKGMKEVGVSEGDVHDRSNWRRIIRCFDL